MPFTPKTWDEDDPITPAELNRIETGIDEAHSGEIDRPTYAARWAYQTAALTGPSGWSGVKNATGRFTITHNLGFASGSEYVALVHAVYELTPAEPRIAIVQQQQVNAVIVYTFDKDWVATDASFGLILKELP